MKKSLALFSVSLLLFSACTSPFGKKEEPVVAPVTSSPTEQTQSATNAQAEAVALQEKESNCKDSGGTFKSGTCTCPKATYGNAATLIFTYNETTGYCEDPDGVPGGVLGTDGKGADL